MPNHALPYSVAVATGATLHNPKRYRGRGPGGGGSDEPPIGEAPANLTISERLIWEEQRRIRWWLRAPDVVLLAAFCRVSARIDEETVPTPALLNILIRMHNLLGRHGAELPTDDDEADM